MKLGTSFYGMSLIPKEYWLDYGYALLTIAGSDGDVSDPEMEWLTIQLGGALHVPEDTIRKWEEFDYDDAELKSIFKKFDTNSVVSFNRLLIYDAVRMSWADLEYADEERERVGEAAALLKVSRETLISIESLIEMEMALEKFRALIF